VRTRFIWLREQKVQTQGTTPDVGHTKLHETDR